MKSRLGILYILSFLAMIISLPLKTETPVREKIYVQQENIFIDKELIEVQIPQGVFYTDLLCRDQSGYYVLAGRLLRSKSKWICDICDWGCGSRKALQAHMEEYH